MSSRVEEIRLNVRFLESQVHSSNVNSSTIQQFEDSCDNSLTLIDELAEEFGDSQELWETECEGLFETVIEIKDFVKTAFERISWLEEENFKLKEELKQLQEKVKELEVIVQDLKHDKDKVTALKLIIGQVAINVDQNVPKHVLDHLEEPDHFIDSIMKMELAIEGQHKNYADVFLNETERKTAEQKWEALQKKVNWSPRLFRYMQDLRKERGNIAHPNVDKDSIRAAMKNIPQEHEQLFLQLFEIHEVVQTYITE